MKINIGIAEIRENWEDCSVVKRVLLLRNGNRFLSLMQLCFQALIADRKRRA